MFRGKVEDEVTRRSISGGVQRGVSKRCLDWGYTF